MKAPIPYPANPKSDCMGDWISTRFSELCQIIVNKTLIVPHTSVRTAESH